MNEEMNEEMEEQSLLALNQRRLELVKQLGDRIHAMIRESGPPGWRSAPEI